MAATTDRFFGHASPPALALPWGHYGVNLFFMISGFVIFVTLHRAKRPMDFVVSRFSPLFPAFWVAVVLSFQFTHALNVRQENVGWSLIMQAQKAESGANLSIVLTTGMVLPMATTLTRLVERPAMRLLRERERARTSPVAPAAL